LQRLGESGCGMFVQPLHAQLECCHQPGIQSAGQPVRKSAANFKR
jgi:hypothetical protein